MEEEKNTENIAPEQSLENKIAEDDKIIAAIGYIWVLFLIPLLLKKKSNFCQHHAKQGLVLFIFWIVINVVGAIPILGWLIMFLGWLAIIFLAVLGFTHAVKGEMWEMPYLGKYTQKINL